MLRAPSGTEDQDVAKPKYFMVGCYTHPVFDKADGKGEAAEFPTEGAECFEDEAEDKVEGATMTPKRVDALLEELPAEDWERPEAPAPVPKPIALEHRKRLDAHNAKWDEIAKACKDQKYKIVEVPMMETLPAKSTPAIISALNRFYARLRAWGLPVFRLHSDCAPELTHGLDIVACWQPLRCPRIQQ